MDAIDQVLDQFNLEDFEDRISDLSSVPTHSLFSLSTKDTVCMSVLSKTWEMQWTCILDLDFDDALLFSHCVINRKNFASFVEKVLYNYRISHAPITIMHAKLLDGF